MRRYLKAANGRFLGSRPNPAKAPKPQHQGGSAKNNQSGDRAHTSSISDPNNPSATPLMETLSAAWEQHHTDIDTRVRPQKTIVSSNTLKEGRELIGDTHTHVQARYTIYAEHHLVSQKLLQAGYACSIPMPRRTYAARTPETLFSNTTSGTNDHTGAERMSADLNPTEVHLDNSNSVRRSSVENRSLTEQVENLGIWKIEPHPEDPHATIATTPHVSNNHDGWSYLETGLRHVTGPRFLRPKMNILLVGTTPVTPPMQPPTGYAPIKGVRSLIYSK